MRWGGTMQAKAGYGDKDMPSCERAYGEVGEAKSEFCTPIQADSIIKSAASVPNPHSARDLDEDAGAVRHSGPLRPLWPLTP